MKQRIFKIAAAAGLCLLLLVMMPAMAMASTDVPALVMEARDGVVRIIAEIDGGFSLGTGFIVGQEDDYYVVTNYHVTDDAQTVNGEIRIYYDTGKYVEGEVYYNSPERDLCVLKPLRSITGAKVLPLQSEEFDSGLAVYALGYPGAADMLSGDWYTYEKADDVKADKQSMTITDGIISAIRDSKLVGDMTHTVRVVQTNTVINHGNSGGPLLDSYGNVLAINTYGVSEEQGSVEGMFGCVHVSELISVLRAAHISYYTAQEAEAARNAANQEPVTQQANVGPIIIIAVAVVAAVGGIILVLVMHKRKNKDNTAPFPQAASASPYAGQGYPAAGQQPAQSAQPTPPAQPYQNQSYPGQAGYPNQNYPTQSYPAQNQPAQNYPGQSYPAQNQPGQNYPGQGNYPGQNYPR